MSFEDLVRTQPPIGSRRTIWKELMRGYKEEEYRKEPPEVGPGHRGRWYLNLPRASRASKSFDRARSGILEVISNALPREDAPIEAQAQELADLLFILSLYRSLGLADLLTKALKAKPLGGLKTTQALGSKDRDEALDPRDVTAIRSFIGRTGYLDEAWDDPTLLVLLDRRPAAPRAMEIFQRCLERIAATPTPMPPSSAAPKIPVASRAEAMFPGRARDAKKPQKIAEREKAGRAAARQKHARKSARAKDRGTK